MKRGNVLPQGTLPPNVNCTVSFHFFLEFSADNILVKLYILPCEKKGNEALYINKYAILVSSCFSHIHDTLCIIRENA